MRLPLIVAVTAAVLLAGGLVVPFASSTAEAQSQRGPVRLTVRPRHFLDAGTKVAPGTARYHNYSLPENSQQPGYLGPWAPTLVRVPVRGFYWPY